MNYKTNLDKNPKFKIKIYKSYSISKGEQLNYES